MTLADFLSRFDTPGAVVLLEGKRTQAMRRGGEQYIQRLGQMLPSSARYLKFRSGNADGSDYFFSFGVSEINRSRMEVIVPYKGHRESSNVAGETHALDAMDLAAEPDVFYLTGQNIKNAGLIRAWKSGVKSAAAAKGAYLLRDTVKVTGVRPGLPPATAALFYDDISNPRSGGTGHTMLMCDLAGVPWYDQSVWMPWLDQAL